MKKLSEFGVLCKNANLGAFANTQTMSLVLQLLAIILLFLSLMIFQ
jgi:flagellar biogenesis protein FliO